MKKVFICLLIVLSCFLLTGCDGKKHIGNISYKEFDKVSEFKSTSGKLDSGNKWDSSKYVLDGLVVSILRVENNTISANVTDDENTQKEKINDLEYYVVKSDSSLGIVTCQYYLQVDKDSYTMTFTYKKDKEKEAKKVIDEFLKSIEVKKSK